ncbi:MAG TPA: TetR/AcrR family transcriptional regulator [Anaeromyxobacter sp.]|nr:TetR/AcrR family transcriptional regulator [Anaeromyxobacter sp.]
MPWPAGHKQRTRERIIRAAAAAFRERGITGVRVEEIMAAAGLTHGGFYAHFAAKDDLLGPAVDRASGETLEMMSSVAASADDARRLRAAIDAYLSPEHVSHPERGCPVAALGPEIARAHPRARRELGRSIQERLAWLRQLLPRKRRPDDVAVGTLAGMVGGIVLARAVGEKDSGAILEACRRFLHRAADE